MATNNKPKIRMTREAYNKQQQILDDLIRTLNASRGPLSDAIKGIDTDGSSDISEVQVEILEMTVLIGKIKYLTEKLKNIDIVDVTEELDEQIVGIGDTVNIDLYSRGEVENIDVILVCDNCDAETNKISIDSPMGECIIGHRIGDKLSYYTMKNEFKLTILKIEKTKTVGRVLKISN